MLNPATPFFCTVRHNAQRTLMPFCIDSLSIEVSGHGVQIEDTDGDEVDGLDECSLLCLLGMHVTNGISNIGICAMDYCGDDPYPTADTPGLIVDDVSRF
jgi:hypothetical protein